ncbi:MAG TPA: heat shock protein HspQ [Caulobacteraceae bacterium]|jgi:heat shock protein HspQ|nr:heat shock protein HspQ [Caulobacteraceae bacterium]
MNTHIAKFGIGQIVRHRTVPFRGVIFDADPEYASSDERWLSIPPADRPRKDQPFYHLLAESGDETYVAYVSEQNLVLDETGQPVLHPEADFVFAGFDHGAYRPRPRPMN